MNQHHLLPGLTLTVAGGRPARPPSERYAVIAASNIVSGELGTDKSAPIAREIARRVVNELINDLSLSRDDELKCALHELRLTSTDDPVLQLAFCPAIDTVELLIALRLEGVRDRYGRYCTQAERQIEMIQIRKLLEKKLSDRYVKQLRK